MDAPTNQNRPAPTLAEPPVIAFTPLQLPVPGILESLALCGIFLASSLPIQLLATLSGLKLGMFDLLLLQQLIGWPATIWIGRAWSGASWGETLLLHRFRPRIIPALLLASFGATILLLEAAGWIPMPEFLRTFLEQQMSGAGKLSLFWPVVVVAPVAEELFFRGQVLRGYRGRYSARRAVWASATLFAAFHLNPWQAVIALPLGLGFAWLVLRTGSTIPGILAHATVNFSTNFLLGPLGLALGYTAEQMRARQHFPWPMLAVGAGAVLVGGLILRRQLRPQTQPAW